MPGGPDVFIDYANHKFCLNGVQYCMGPAGKESVSDIVPYDKWTAVGISIDTQDEAATWYLDGIAISGGFPPGLACGGLDDFVLGDGYEGEVDELRIYSRPLTFADVAKDSHKQGINVSFDFEPVSVRFDEEGGFGELFDLSGFENTATLSDVDLCMASAGPNESMYCADDDALVRTSGKFGAGKSAHAEFSDSMDDTIDGFAVSVWFNVAHVDGATASRTIWKKGDWLSLSFDPGDTDLKTDDSLIFTVGDSATSVGFDGADGWGYAAVSVAKPDSDCSATAWVGRRSDSSPEEHALSCTDHEWTTDAWNLGGKTETDEFVGLLDEFTLFYVPLTSGYVKDALFDHPAHYSWAAAEYALDEDFDGLTLDSTPYGNVARLFAGGGEVNGVVVPSSNMWKPGYRHPCPRSDRCFEFTGEREWAERNNSLPDFPFSQDAYANASGDLGMCFWQRADPDMAALNSDVDGGQSREVSLAAVDDSLVVRQLLRHEKSSKGNERFSSANLEAAWASGELLELRDMPGFGEWSRLCVFVSRLTGIASWFVDGRLRRTGAAWAPDVVTGGAVVRVGSDGSGKSGYRGNLSAVTYHSRSVGLGGQYLEAGASLLRNYYRLDGHLGNAGPSRMPLVKGQGTVTFTNSGYLGKGLALDGESTLTAVPPNTPAVSSSDSIWVGTAFRTTSSTAQDILGIGDSDDKDLRISLTEGNKVKVSVHDQASVTLDIPASADGYADNKWHGLALEILGTNGAYDGSGPCDRDVYGRVFNPDGTGATVDFRCNSHLNDDQYEPAVCHLEEPGDYFMAVWTSDLQDGSGTAIVGRKFNSDGTPAGNEFQINQYISDRQERPSVAALTDGRFVVAWQTWKGSDAKFDVVARFFVTDDHPAGGEFTVHPADSQDQIHPAVAAWPGGEFVIVFEDQSISRTTGVWLAAFDDVGNTQADWLVHVGDVLSGTPSVPSVAAFELDSGERTAVVAWTTADAVGMTDVALRRHDIESTTGIPTPYDIALANDYATDEQSYVSAAASTGSVLVAWQSYYQDGSRFGIYGRLYEPDTGASGLAALGSEFGLNLFTTDHQRAVATTGFKDGRFGLVWESDGQDGDDYGLYGQLLRQDGEKLWPCTLSPCQPNQWCNHGACECICPAGTVCYGDTCCEPACEGKDCGDDACGGVCGHCETGFECLDGLCSCVPDCSQAECGGDGCGGSCGACVLDEECLEGNCICTFESCAYACCGQQEVCWDGSCCEPQCDGVQCGDDSCGGICGDCIPGEVCHAGQCCVPDCVGKDCGDDSCGGSCGSCPPHAHCGENWSCLCDFLNCGPDCCSEQAVCWEDACCEPLCEGKECGSDGCGGECGTCAAGEDCHEGLCCVPDCTGKVCGENGCGGSCWQGPGDECDNEVYCDGTEKCEQGQCVHDLDIEEVKADECPVGHECLQLLCSESEQETYCWQNDGLCAGGTCTDNYCLEVDPDEGVFQCVSLPNTGADCDDNDACTTLDMCFEGTCVGSSSLECDDGNWCTDDSCDPATGCVFVSNSVPCDDGDACTAADTCAEGQCVGTGPVECDDGNPCTDDSCAPVSGCVHVSNSGPCDDGNGCTVGDFCQSGTCHAGPDQPDCDDQDPCTSDYCMSPDGCKHNPTTGPLCDDTDLCTTDDQCQAGECVGVSINCDDGNVCTTNWCDPATGDCVHDPVPDATTCDDSNACTQGDTCQDGECQGGGLVDCEDGNNCTVDQCHPSSGCQHTPASGQACTDGNACTLGDSCDAEGVCTPGVDLVECEDQIACTEDSCQPSTGECVFEPNHTACDDGDACTQDQCDVVVGCVVPPLPVEYDDSNQCTQDECDSQQGCMHSPMDDGSTCSDGDSCTVGDSCLQGACQSGDPVPPEDYCGETCCLPNEVCGDGEVCTTCGNGQCDEAEDCLTCPGDCSPWGAVVTDLACNGNATVGDTSDDTTLAECDGDSCIDMYEGVEGEHFGPEHAYLLKAPANQHSLVAVSLVKTERGGGTLDLFAFGKDGCVAPHPPDEFGHMWFGMASLEFVAAPDSLHYVVVDGFCPELPASDVPCSGSYLLSVTCQDACGDGECASYETHSSCSDDCGLCGDGVCSADESCTCSADCGPCCGDGVCAATTGETCSTCPSDCGDCSQADCGNDICEPGLGENLTTCPDDCATHKCGNLLCEAWNLGEDCFVCPQDCGMCCPLAQGNGTCDWVFGENVYNCPEDCLDVPGCGDSVCDAASETCYSCPSDCGLCCGDGSCQTAYGENINNCPSDCEPVAGCGDEICDEAGGESCDQCSCFRDCCGKCYKSTPDQLYDFVPGVTGDDECDAQYPLPGLTENHFGLDDYEGLCVDEDPGFWEGPDDLYWYLHCGTQSQATFSVSGRDAVGHVRGLFLYDPQQAAVIACSKTSGGVELACDDTVGRLSVTWSPMTDKAYFLIVELAPDTDGRYMLSFELEQ